MQLYFIRHAQSANNRLYDETGTWNGRDTDPDLTRGKFAYFSQRSEDQLLHRVTWIDIIQSAWVEGIIQQARQRQHPGVLPRTIMPVGCHSFSAGAHGFGSCPVVW